MPRLTLLALFALLLAALPLQAEEPADPAARKALLTQEVRELRALEKAGTIGIELLDQMVRAVPELLWLEETAFRDGQMRLSGRAFNMNAVADFIERLDAVPAFEEPALIETAEDLEDECYSFTLAFRVDLLPLEEAKEEAGIEALKRERDELRKRLARREDVPRLLGELRALAEELDLGGASLVEAKARDRRMARVDVDLATTFHGLQRWFDGLRGLSALATLEELTIRQELSERGTVAASFRLRIPLREPAP